jgi:predicted aspartyl protease
LCELARTLHLPMGFIHAPVTLRSFERPAVAYEANFLVDTGATDSMAPASELRRIGVMPMGQLTYELADGSAHVYEFGLARMELMERVTAGRVIFGPDGVGPLLGITVLESIGATIDPVTQTLKLLPTLRLKSVRNGSEPEVEGREAELGAAEDGGGFLGVVAGVGAHGVDVAPGALDRVR